MRTAKRCAFSPGGLVAAPGDSVMEVCIVVCFAWLFVRVFCLGYAWMNYEPGGS